MNLSKVNYMDAIEEPNNSLLDEVYTMCWVSKGDVQEEKSALLEQYVQINYLLNVKFAENENLEKAKVYFSNVMQDFFNETEFEDRVYETIIAYFECFDDLTDCKDTKLLEEFKEILSEFDEKIDRRFL